MNVVCSNCHRKSAPGRCCERCGKPLVAEASPDVAPPPAAPAPVRFDEPPTERPVAPAPAFVRPEPVRVAPPVRYERPAAARVEHMAREERLERSGFQSAATEASPSLEFDRVCTLFEDMTGIVRFRLDPRGAFDPFEPVTITFSNDDCAKTPTHRVRHAVRTMEFSVQFPPQAAGLQSWEARIEYSRDGRRRELAGCFQVVVVPVKSRAQATGNVSVNFSTNIGSVSQASDVRVSQPGVDSLARYVANADPFEAMRRIGQTSERDWAWIDFADDSLTAELPPPPAAARVDRLTLTLDVGKVHFFSGRTIRFGRQRETNDFTLRPADGYSREVEAAYMAMSRNHCIFEHSGDEVAIVDGSREDSGRVKPSSGGTYWNDGRVTEKRLAAGRKGILSFAGASCAGAVSLEVEAVSPCAACAACPHADRLWCDEGRRPSLVLSRRDGVPEKFVALWSCLPLEVVDRSFGGTVVFRQDGAFAYRRSDGRSGWLVPGEDVRTPWGTVRVD